MDNIENIWRRAERDQARRERRRLIFRRVITPAERMPVTGLYRRGDGWTTQKTLSDEA